MQLISLYFKKISGYKDSDFKKTSIDTNIQFTDVNTEKISLLKDSDSAKISFNFMVNYNQQKDKEKKQGEVLLEGEVIFALTKEELKDITKSWKKKKLPEEFRISLLNFLLRKCSTKALYIEEELGLPPHIPLPTIRKEK